MTLDELKIRLDGLEWNDIEFKEAAWQVPKDIYETVSAFSNTSGGWIVFGIKDSKGVYSIEGVFKADDIQNGFVGTLRSRGKMSCAIEFKEDQLNDDGKTVLVFYIPEVPRTAKPVHLDGKLNEAFVRKAGTTQRCQPHELAAFLRDASAQHYEDELVLNLDPSVCFDTVSVSWYRSLFIQRNPGHETEGRDDLFFLEHFGLLLPHDNSLRPTRAAVLLFGTAAANHRAFSRQQVDFFRFLSRKEDTLPETRWDDRIESLSEGNIVKTWRRIIEVYREHYASSGRFELDATTMQRTGAPPDYLAFREAVLNLLIHQDYGDQNRKATIHAYTDSFEFWNPGASYVTGDEFFKPGDKPVRNPKLRSMLTRVGIGEQANTGIKNIYSHQRTMGRVAPVIENDPANHSFRIVLSKESRLSARQQALLKRLGVRLSDEQAAIFLHCWRSKSITLLEAQSVAGLGLQETVAALNYLDTQMLLEKAQATPTQSTFHIRPHLREIHPDVDLLPDDGAPSMSPTPEVTGEVTPEVAPEVTPEVKKLLGAVKREMSRSEIMAALGLRDEKHFREQYQQVGIALGMIEMTIPDKPQSSQQRYRLTAKAKAWLLAQN